MDFERNDIVFLHMIDLPNCGCVFCSTKNRTTSQTRLYLIFSESKAIYTRRGVNDCWCELRDFEEYKQVISGFDSAIEERKLPCFSA